MRVSEWIVVGYVAALVLAGFLRRMPLRHRLLLTGTAGCLGIVTAVCAARASAAVRDWAPLVYVSVGYYLSGKARAPHGARLEAWLRRCDARLLGDPARRFRAWPAPVLALLDVIYMACFLLLPAGLLALIYAGARADADHYWTLVLGADFGAFASLLVVQTRPPWAVEPPADLRDRRVHGLASIFVRRATIGINTVPSGHTAVSLAVALAVLPVLPLLGWVLLGLALGIGLACVVGRYHYSVDVLGGVILAYGVWAVTSMTHP